MENSSRNAPTGKPEYEVLLIGAGVCGLYQLIRLRELGLSFLAVDANSGPGGTWFRNRYPGCRLDSECYSYGYSFSPKVLAEWDWSETFASGEEVRGYYTHVSREFGLERHIEFDTRVAALDWDDAASMWIASLDDGRQVSARFVASAIGLLSIPVVPSIPDIASFSGPVVHTYDWPDSGLDVTGKRVAVIGTGSSGVQLISAIADQVAELLVFQRRPNWCAPLNNQPLDASAMAQIKSSYDEIFALCAASPSGFVHAPILRRTLEVPAEERIALWEALYQAPGMGIWLGNFRDTLTRLEANRELSAFVAGKIRSRVADPCLAEKLIPKDHGFGMRRVVLETNYYEIYNYDHVRLIDVAETPLVSATPTGLRTTTGEFEADLLAFATGFDAITGPYDRIRITGRDGVRLHDKWRDGPLTSLGVSVHGFPNLITLVGPQGGSVAANYPRGIETVVDWATALLDEVRRRGAVRLEATQRSEDEWQQHLAEMAAKMLMSRSKSWLTGYNTNVGRDVEPRLMIYTGGSDRYRQRLDSEREAGYPSFVFT